MFSGISVVHRVSSLRKLILSLIKVFTELIKYNVMILSSSFFKSFDSKRPSLLIHEQNRIRNILGNWPRYSPFLTN